MLKMKKILSMSLAICIITSITQNASAQENEYMETSYQINFSDFRPYVFNNDELCFSVSSNLSEDDLKNVNENIDTLENLFDEFPDLENDLADATKNGEIKAVSFTEVPLIWENNHYERVPMSQYSNFETSDSNGKGKFLMFTSIGGGYKQVSSNYEYNMTTQGYWSKNSILGGSDYPDAGNDFIFQTCPTSFKILSDSMNAWYDDGSKGSNGKHFWREDGDDNYVRYVIQDDPLGYVQNSNFTLNTKAVAPKSNQTRRIGSYYVHTWDQLDLSFSISASSDKLLQLSLTPSLKEKSWQVYNYVTFNF